MQRIDRCAQLCARPPARPPAAQMRSAPPPFLRLRAREHLRSGSEDLSQGHGACGFAYYVLSGLEACLRDLDDVSGAKGRQGYSRGLAGPGRGAFGGQATGNA